MNHPLELWGGLECTVARIGDDFRDQSLETGHRDRIEDLDRIADLGIRTLRYPILWETISPVSPDEADFSWHDERVARMQQLGIRAIAGLCHHGSGPGYTDMLDPAWPELLARHARNVAERYPHLDLYTPVNEPLTTARFSGLYGHWYPHGTGYGPFLTALVNECKATVLAMRAIRRIRPDAQLVQTDDMGKTFSTPALAYQAEHENQRRWLTFDLLCGMVDRHHPWWRILRDHGVSEDNLNLFLEADAAPDIIGINHYLTSERYLDQNLNRYPEHHWGGNGRDRYADAEAVRMPLPAAELGPVARLRETWERYRRPVAVTEAHHGCTRDEQLRWLVEIWNGANQLRNEGADIRAVTVWSLFGTVDWNTLLTQRNGIYEPGPYDVRGPEPRRTALAQAAEALAKQGAYDHPVLDRAGWWKRDIRFYRPPARRSNACRLVGSPRQLLITGATGTLGRAFSRICDIRGLDHVLLSRHDMDICDPTIVREVIACEKPWAVVNAAGYVRPAQAEEEPERCFRENAVGAENLARICAEFGIPLVAFSSDLVFDGTLDRPYTEGDDVSPSGVYGASKVEAERRVLSAHDGALVVRTSAFFGPWDRYNFVWNVLNTLSRGDIVDARADLVSPTYVPDLVHEVLNLLIDGATGLWHLANTGAVSWYDFARMAAERAGYDPDLVTQNDEGGIVNTALDSERGLLLPSFDSAFDRFFNDSEISWSAEDTLSVAAE
ncbi:family 1 glycosylhydrolase [Microvirga subterranea]|uniref:dTDP-4-dehydrorhamnose reductase n=1 Tax=Microvirga subterranea TaxID=186651 RepID=A0A370HTS8_9HYPH|nr:family 1 glycosylhydrolase [Microvirga subterranea]RDI61922.1 dTDP-4-dehydrorhamnose reductase [Microvirga subterranea]